MDPFRATRQLERMLGSVRASPLQEHFSEPEPGAIRPRSVREIVAATQVEGRGRLIATVTYNLETREITYDRRPVIESTTNGIQSADRLNE